MPSRFAVRMTRQAISPRLAIRILRNTDPLPLHRPVRLALVEEGGQPLLSFRTGAAVGDILRGEFPQRLVDHGMRDAGDQPLAVADGAGRILQQRSEEHTSELQSLMRNSYAVFCLKQHSYALFQSDK